MNNSNGAKAKAKNSLLNFLLIVTAILQGSSQILEFLALNKSFKIHPLLNSLIALGKSISENWITYSISSLLLVSGYFLYKHLYDEDDSNDPAVKRGKLNSVFLLAINLVLCNRIYSSTSISEKAEYISVHFPAVIVLFIIGLIAALGILFIKNERSASRELEALSPLESESNAENNDSHKTNKMDIHMEASFRMRHPVSYWFRSFFKYADKKRDLKYKHRKAVIETKTAIKLEKKKQESENIKQGTPDTKNRSEIFRIIGETLIALVSPLISLVLTILTIWTFLSLINHDNKGQILFSLDSLIETTEAISNWLNNLEQPLIEFLFAIGIPFLFIIICLTIYLLFYIFIRLTFYILLNGKEDENKIRYCAKSIKVFVFHMIESILRLVLFIPDFIEHLEYALLGTDMDEKINEFYSDDEDSDGEPID